MLRKSADKKARLARAAKFTVQQAAERREAANKKRRDMRLAETPAMREERRAKARRQVEALAVSRGKGQEGVPSSQWRGVDKIKDRDRKRAARAAKAKAKANP